MSKQGGKCGVPLTSLSTFLRRKTKKKHGTTSKSEPCPVLPRKKRRFESKDQLLNGKLSHHGSKEERAVAGGHASFPRQVLQGEATLWIDEIRQRTTLKPWLKPWFVGICRSIVSFQGFLGGAGFSGHPKSSQNLFAGSIGKEKCNNPHKPSNRWFPSQEFLSENHQTKPTLGKANGRNTNTNLFLWPPLRESRLPVCSQQAGSFCP